MIWWHKAIYILASILGIVGILIIGFALRPFYFPHLRKVVVSESKSLPALRSRLLLEASRKNPETRKELIARYHTDDITMREIVAEAIGFFHDDEVNLVIQKLLEDSNLSVRIKMLQSIGNLSLAEREQWLLDYLKKQISVEETVAVHAALLRISKINETRNRSAENLSLVALQGDSPLQTQAAIQASAYAADNVNVKKMMIQKIKEATNLSVMATAISSLVRMKDPWIKEQLSQLSENKDMRIKVAIVYSLHILCPNDRWSILEKMKKTNDVILLRAIAQEASNLGGRRGREMSEQIKSLLPQQLKATLSAEVSLVDPCKTN